MYPSMDWSLAVTFHYGNGPERNLTMQRTYTSSYEPQYTIFKNVLCAYLPHNYLYQLYAN